MNKILYVASLIGLLGGIMLSAVGLYKLPWPSALPWQGKEALICFLSYVMIVSATIVLVSSFSRINVRIVSIGLGLAITIMASALWPFIIVSSFFSASYLLGRHALWRLGITPEDTRPLLILLVGAGLYGTSVGILAHFPVNLPWAYYVFLLVPFFIERKNFVVIFRSFRQNIFEPKKIFGSKYWLETGIYSLAAVYLIAALLPEVDYDSLAVHLFVPGHLADRHQWGFDASLYAFAVMPMLADWIYAFNFMIGGETAARLTNIGFIFVLAGLIYDLTVWAGGSGRAGRLAVLILLTTPLTFLEGSTLHVEGVWAAFLLGASVPILNLTSSDAEKVKESAVVGVLLAFALATKMITLLMLPVIGGLLLWKWHFWVRRKFLLTIGLAAIFFVLLGSIPYIDAWRITGNPVFPFFNKIFQSPLFPIENFKDMRWQIGFTPDMLYALTFHSERYQEARAGAPGYQWLVFLVPSLLLLLGMNNRRALLLLLIGLLSVVLVFNFTATYLRYVYPATIFLIAAMAVAIENGILNGKLIGRVIFLVAVVLVLVLNFLFLNAASWYGDFQIRTIFDPKTREAYLARRLPERAAVNLVNMLNTAENPVAFISSPFAAGLKADALHAAWYNNQFLESVQRISSDNDALNLLLDRSVDYIILDKTWGMGNSSQGKHGELELQRNHLAEVTTEVADFGPVSVRKIKTDLRFREELLKDVNFSSKENWIFSPGAVLNSQERTVLVSESSTISQQVTVREGRQYKNRVIARCASNPTKGRMQINWHDASSSFIKADIVTFDCSKEWTSYEMTVVAPASTSFAIVYTSGHESEPLAFRINSLLQ